MKSYYVNHRHIFIKKYLHDEGIQKQFQSYEQIGKTDHVDVARPFDQPSGEWGNKNAGKHSKCISYSYKFKYVLGHLQIVQ